MNVGLNLDPPLDTDAVHAATQHATAGKAALALLQDTEKDAKTIDPDQGILEHVQSLVQFAQKAEMSRKILERYLLGTEINRIDPVYVPSAPPSYSQYTYPNLDPSVQQSPHMPTDVNAPPKPVGLFPRSTPTRVGVYPSTTPRLARAELPNVMLLTAIQPTRNRQSISNFI